MKKVLILSIVLLSGCSANYNLEISENSFKETINVVIDKNEIPNKNQTIDDIELSDQITPFLESENLVFFSNSDIKYNKKVEEFTDYYNVEMDYIYIPEEFENSNSLNMCFSDFEFNTNENYYIHAYGNFYCLYTETMKINVITNNKVIKNNADSVRGNVYTWVIDNSNINNIDIEFEVSKEISYQQLLIKVVLSIILISLLSFMIYVVVKKRKSNKF